MQQAPGRVLLFHREMHRFRGGHLKVRHSFAHAERSTRFRPRIHVVPSSDATASELWRGTPEPPLASWQPELAAASFVAGDDWPAIPDPSPVPVINLIQYVRHADPGTTRWTALARPAIRICVSREVADAIEATGRVNGPVHVIPAGLDPAELPPPVPRRERSLVIAGLKNPEFALAVHGKLAAAGHESDCIVDRLPRAEFLARLARSEVVITLPKPREGFFLPALEAMAIGAITVCPDCLGNRSFCRDGETAFRAAVRARGRGRRAGRGEPPLDRDRAGGLPPYPRSAVARPTEARRPRHGHRPHRHPPLGHDPDLLAAQPAPAERGPARADGAGETRGARLPA